MTAQMKIFMCLLILNAVIAIGYLAANLIWKKQKNYLFSFFVMLLCPVVGPVFYFLAYIWYKLFFQAPVDLEDVIFSKDRVKTSIRAEEEQERNMVSLEEAIEITNERDLRNLMMNIVKGDIQKSLAAISLALNSEDTETAHYAASVLQDALNDFRMTVEKQKKLMDEDQDNRGVYADMLLDYMNQVLKQRVFTDMEQQSYVEEMDQIGEILYAGSPDDVDINQMEALIMRLLEIEDFEKCEKWCGRAKLNYPNTLATYTCQLKLYFSCGRKDKFFEVIEELKHSSVVVDRETLELMRVFR